MRSSIKLYSADPAAADPAHIVPVVATLDFSKELTVSRTIGPENWLEINQRDLAGEAGVAFPKEDLTGLRHTDSTQIVPLARKGSVLTISYAFTKSQRISALSRAIGTQVPEKGQGFYASSAWFNFGPSDIIEFTEDDDGEDDVELVAVAHFSLTISCDNYPGRLDILASSLDSVPEFVSFRDDLQKIVGPLVLRVS